MKQEEFSGFIVWDLLTGAETRDKGAKSNKDQRTKLITEKSKNTGELFQMWTLHS